MSRKAGIRYSNTIASGNQILSLICEVGLAALWFTVKGCFTCTTPSCMLVSATAAQLCLHTRKRPPATSPCLHRWVDKCYRVPQANKWPTKSRVLTVPLPEAWCLMSSVSSVIQMCNRLVKSGYQGLTPHKL